MDNIDFDWDKIVDNLNEYGYHVANSKWFDEHSTWRNIFFSYPENNK